MKKALRYISTALMISGFILALLVASASDANEINLIGIVRGVAISITVMGLGFLGADVSDRLMSPVTAGKRELKKASYAKLERELKRARAAAEESRKNYEECFDAMYAAERERDDLQKEYSELHQQFRALYAFATGAGLDIPDSIAS